MDISFFGSIYEKDLPHRAVSVYMYLKDRSDAEGKCWPAINTIARDLSMSRSSVKRALSDLDKSGMIRKQVRRRENGGKTSNFYFVSERR